MADDWILIPRRRGKRPEGERRVTLAWRCYGTRKQERGMTAFINVPRPFIERLGWQLPGWIEVASDPSRTRLRIRMLPAEIKTAFRIGAKDGCGCFTAALEWVDSERRSAAPVDVEIDGGALIVTLPAWAAQKPALKPLGRPAIPLVEPKPAMPDKPAAMPDKGPGIDDSGPAIPDKAYAPPKWTPERRGLLRTLWLARNDTAEIAARLNALPGLPIARNEVSAYAVAGLKLPSLSAMAAAAEAEARQAAPIPRPQAPPPRAADDKAEAIKLLEAGLSGREVADEIGLPLSVVSNWAAEVRLKARRGEQAA